MLQEPETVGSAVQISWIGVGIKNDQMIRAIMYSRRDKRYYIKFQILAAIFDLPHRPTPTSDSIHFVPPCCWTLQMLEQP